MNSGELDEQCHAAMLQYSVLATADTEVMRCIHQRGQSLAHCWSASIDQLPGTAYEIDNKTVACETRSSKEGKRRRKKERGKESGRVAMSAIHGARLLAWTAETKTTAANLHGNGTRGSRALPW
jgi:hypothetical protein